MRDVTVDALQDRQQLVSASRVVVKIGSSSLTGPDGRLAPERLNALVDVLAARRAAGGQVVLVSSGAIAAGLGPLGLAARPRDLATQQAAASVGQGLLVAHYTAAFARYGLQVGQVLLTADDTVRRVHYRNAHRALTRLLDLGIVPVINENDAVATDEIRFGDNDRLAALVSHLVHADALLLLSDVDSLYTGPPSRDGSRRIASVVHAAGPRGHRRRLAGQRRRHRRDGDQARVGRDRDAVRGARRPDVRRAGRAGAGRAGRRDVVHRDRSAHVDPAAVARARREHARTAGARRRRGPGGPRAGDLAAARRGDRRRGHVRGGGPRRARRPRRSPRGARAGLVRRRGGPAAARPLDLRAARVAGPGLRPRAGPPRRPGPGPQAPLTAEERAGGAQPSCGLPPPPAI